MSLLIRKMLFSKRAIKIIFQCSVGDCFECRRNWNNTENRVIIRKIYCGFFSILYLIEATILTVKTVGAFVVPAIAPAPESIWEGKCVKQENCFMIMIHLLPMSQKIFLLSTHLPGRVYARLGPKQKINDAPRHWLRAKLRH